MKTTVVPAQITTVEDKIAGSLTFTQIIMLVIPLLTSTAIYVLILPSSRTRMTICKGILREFKNDWKLSIRTSCSSSLCSSKFKDETDRIER